MIIVPIFEPLWKCEYGNVQHYGEGLLETEAWKSESGIDSFCIKLSGYEMVVRPKSGQILIDGEQTIQTESGHLVWSREMAVDINTHDANTRSSPRCNHYRIGIKNGSGSHGYRIYDSGRMTFGL